VEWFEEAELPDGAAIVVDRKGYIVAWNEGAEAVLGFSATEVVGRACHHVLCGRDPSGLLVCHPWCSLSPADTRRNPNDDVVLYPRSAARDIVRVTLSVFRLGGADGKPAWVVHLMTSAETIPAAPRAPWYAGARRSLLRYVRKPKPPETDQR